MQVHGHKLSHNDIELVLQVGQYSNGLMCIHANCKVDGYVEPYATLTVNLREHKQEDNELFIKTWSENEEFANVMLSTGLFKDTGKRIPTGYVEASVWTLAEGVTLK